MCRDIHRRTLAVLVVVLVAASDTTAWADEDADPARTAFREGAALVEQAEWAGALALFERSLAIRPHALTLYNLGVCQRFLGRHTLARETLMKALVRGQRERELPELFVEQTRTYLGEIDAKLSRLVVTVSPKEARVAVDGRPLAPVADQDGVFVAGIAEPGAARSVGRDTFEVVVDPRPTVLTFVLDGHDTIEIKKQPKPGGKELVPVSMTGQPAQMQITSNVPNAIVRVDGVDVGLVPVVVSRPPGVRAVSVTTEGYVPYESKITLKPGQILPLDAKLAPERPPITKKWWFWAGAAATVLAAGLVTYLVVRPEPERPSRMQEISDGSLA